MEIEEFNAFDIGQHYLKLQREEVNDRDVGELLRRFVQTFAPVVAREDKTIAFGVDLKEVEKNDVNLQ